MKVAALYIGIPHWLASCQDCDWSNEFSGERTKGYTAVRKHVAQTGHTVQVESCQVTQYFIDDGE